MATRGSGHRLMQVDASGDAGPGNKQRRLRTETEKASGAAGLRVVGRSDGKKQRRKEGENGLKSPRYDRQTRGLYTQDRRGRDKYCTTGKVS